MIKSKKDYKEYLKADLIASGIDGMKWFNRICDRRFKFYKSLRKSEYYINCKKGVFGKLIGKLIRMRHILLCNKYGWVIPENVFGKGLCIVHVGTIVVTGDAKIGEHCRIHACTNIGRALAKGKAGAPVIGKNVYIGPGVKMFGPIEIGDNVAIGANAVVNSSFPDGNCTIAGVPAKKISDNTSANIMKIHEFK